MVGDRFTIALRQKLVGAGSPIVSKDTQRLKNPPPPRAIANQVGAGLGDYRF
ncbi:MULTISPECIES: hypothetical protein [unclassified Microcoleus]|uniref:hypothetical protein n=1 Tax=unclassified Microcoleus TaxID=2642155 RepID=UPI002FD4FA68